MDFEQYNPPQFTSAPIAPLILPTRPPLWRRPAFWASLGVTALIIAGFMWLLSANRNTFSRDAVQLEVEAPRDIRAGDRVSYFFRYQNTSTIDVANARLIFYVPSDALVIEGNEAKATTTLTIPLGTLAAGQSG
jgi:hypothetical protein